MWLECTWPSWQRFSFDEDGGTALVFDRDQAGIVAVPPLFLCTRDIDLDLEAECEFDPDPDLELPFVPWDLEALLSNVESPAVP